ncbi:hypothetical protein BBJ28_00009634 [Nothophytophthora sp. Chile5]|nr:hypothetical protein BBJ28_00009632 [Nothophytophthora sp. Chile5]RLN06362.1 hypothetical protein BBJ28_00009634 [Nothophytophthora sp. Chile5]
MNAQMAAARHALPLNTPSSLMYLHSKTPAALAADDAKATAVSTESRDSTGAKLSLKMQQLFPGKKERQQNATDASEEGEEDEKKRATLRRLVGSQALLHMGRR